MLFNLSRPAIRASVTLSVVSDQVSITLSYLSSLEIKPLLYALSYLSTFSSASLSIQLLHQELCGMGCGNCYPPLVENLNPKAFMWSNNIAVSVFPCFLKHLSIILPEIFCQLRNQLLIQMDLLLYLQNLHSEVYFH